MVRFNPAITERIRSGLAWEQLLSTLGALPERAPGRNRAIIELVALFTDATLTLDQITKRVGAALARATGLKIVGIFDYRASRLIPLAGNVAVKKLLPIAEDGRLRQFLATKIGRFTLATLRPTSPATSRLVVADLTDNNDARVLVALVDRTLAAFDAKILQAAVALLRLRQKNWRLQENLNFLNRQFSALTDRVAEGLIGIGPELTINLWNKNLYGLTGYRAKRTLGRPYQQFLIVPGEEDWLVKLLADSRSTGGNFQTQLAITTADGRLKWVELSGAALATGRRPAEQILISVRDVSHLRELEARKNEFISIATHELRTPLTAVTGYLSLLSRQGRNLTDAQRRFLSQAQAATSRLSRLTEELLWTVQIQEDRLMFELAPVELATIAGSVAADFHQAAKNQDLSLSLKPPKSSTLILADADRLEQVVCNLVDNALKYTPKGSITLDWRFTSNRRRRSFITLLVQDTGSGIEPKRLPEVFTKFRRLHRPETIRSFGAGLGLFIAKSFVEKMNGTITVTSRLGKGTTFAVTFPCYLPDK